MNDLLKFKTKFINSRLEQNQGINCSHSTVALEPRRYLGSALCTVVAMAVTKTKRPIAYNFPLFAYQTSEYRDLK